MTNVLKLCCWFHKSVTTPKNHWVEHVTQADCMLCEWCLNTGIKNSLKNSLKAALYEWCGAGSRLRCAPLSHHVVSGLCRLPVHSAKSDFFVMLARTRAVLGPRTYTVKSAVGGHSLTGLQDDTLSLPLTSEPRYWCPGSQDKRWPGPVPLTGLLLLWNPSVSHCVKVLEELHQLTCEMSTVTHVVNFSSPK